MNLKALFEGFDYEILSGTPDKDVKSLIYHSDKAEKGSAFFAIKGADSDGKKYIRRAIEKGSEIIVVDDMSDAGDDGFSRALGEAAGENREVTLVRVSDVRKALATAGNNFFKRPQDSLLMIGVTGTKGKTTTSFMIKEIFESAGIKTGIIGTVLTGYEGNYAEADNTTPQSWEIHRMLRDMVIGGCKAAVLEVSSQGLMQQRVFGINFDIGIFTNISPDHIGDREHKNFEDYLYWKSRLFTQTKVAIINRDDAWCKYIADESRADKIISFGTAGSSITSGSNITAGSSITAGTYTADKIALWNEGTTLGVKYNVKGNEGDEIFLGIPGKFNVSNSLSAIAAAREAGIEWKFIERALRNVKVRGRVEIVPAGRDFTVVVDYAHNGVALESLLTTLREYNPGRLIAVFGCGGNRDKNRRWEMGKAAAVLTDFSIITSDNPRDEDPMEIINHISRAMSEFSGKYIVIPDRREAIQYAVKGALPDDIIAIAGKGHETYQIRGSRKSHFDDREVVWAAAEKLNHEKLNQGN